MTPDASQTEERPLRKGERTRLRILRATGQLFASQPPGSIKMDDIAYEAKVSIGTVYNYFPNREAVLLAFTADAYTVLDRYREETRLLKSPMQRVYRAGDSYMEFAIEKPTFVRFMMTRGLQPSDDAELAQINEAVSSRIREMVLQAGADLKEAMDIGEIPVSPIDELTVMLFALWNGMAGLVVRADGTAIPPDLAWRALERSRIVLRRAVAQEFEHPGEAPLASWEVAAPEKMERPAGVEPV